MIPDDAIEAANRAALGRYLNKETVQLILEAAAPHLMAAAKSDAWDEGATAGWESSGEGWNGEYPGHAYANDVPNPYRSAGAGE